MIKSLSVSTLKEFSSCEARGLAIYKGDWEWKDKKFLQLGSYMDAGVQGGDSLTAYIDEHHDEVYRKDGKMRAEYVTATDTLNRIYSDSVFMDYLKGDTQKHLEGSLYGVPFHGYADFITDDRIVDFKYLADTEPRGLQSIVEYRKYHWQLSVYQQLAEQSDGKRRECFLAIATKQDPAELVIVAVPQYLLEEANEEMAKLVPRVTAIINGEVQPMPCHHCDYCRETQPTRVVTPEELGGISE